MPNTLNILLLSEGTAETPHGSFSGSAHSVVCELRTQGHHVATWDVELRRTDKLIAAARAFSPNRERWGARFRLGGAAFSARSKKAARAPRESSQVLVQIGATFEPRCNSIPYTLYCDSNIAMSQRGAATGQSDAAWLAEREIQAITRRETKVYKNAAAIFTLSERLRQSFIDDFAIDPTKVVTVHAGPNFDLDSFQPPPSPPQREQPIILFVGKQFERKGGPQLLEAFRRVRRQVPSARLVIIGPDEIPGSNPGVECLGFLHKDRPLEAKRLAQAYAEATVFCLPTKYEPFGIVFLEAMFFGLPCVGPNAWAVPEMIVDGETGFTFDSEDTNALGDRLLRLLTNAPLARRMGAAGRVRAQQSFTWTAVVDKMLERLEPLASRG